MTIRSTLKGVGWGLLLGVSLAGVGLGLWTHHATPETIAQRLEDLKVPFLLWRLGIMGAVLWGWHPLIDRLGRWGHRTPAELQALHEARGTVACWCVILELLLGQNLVGRITALFP